MDLPSSSNGENDNTKVPHQKHGLHEGDKRQDVVYKQQKIRLKANIHSDLEAIKRNVSSMLDTIEETLNEHIKSAGRDGIDLDERLLDDLINISSYTRAHQELLDRIIEIVNQK